MRFVRRDPDKGYVDNMLWVPKRHINVEGVKNALTFELDQREGGVGLLALWDETPHHLIVPRGTWPASTWSFPIIDCRPTTFTRTGVTSTATLDHRLDTALGRLVPTGLDVQARAFEALKQTTGGTLQLACGFGKTVVALHYAAWLNVPTLVLVDTDVLYRQWLKSISQFLKVPGGVGEIRGPKKEWQRGLVVSTYQTMAQWAATTPEDVRRWFGLVVMDEGHHVNAPYFSRSVPLFYGMRLALSATPTRRDGLHVVCQYHAGPIIFKHVKQRKPPKVVFKWTGVELDPTNAQQTSAVTDVTGELHLGKLAVYFGSYRHRLENIVLPVVRDLHAEGRKIILLSQSVDEVVNLMTIWTRGPDTQLYSEIPFPTLADVTATLEANFTRECADAAKHNHKLAKGEKDGRTAHVKALHRVFARFAAKLARKEGTFDDLVRGTDPVVCSDSKERGKFVNRRLASIDNITKNLAINQGLNAAKRETYAKKREEYDYDLWRDHVGQAMLKLYRARKRAFLAELSAEQSDAGMFTGPVRADVRERMLRERRVIFSIARYGKEGLDDAHLDTVVVAEPMSDRNMLQQIMGRPRDKDNALLLILEDNIPALRAQCHTLRRHLTNWPVDEGGPFQYALDGHPATQRRKRNLNGI